MKNLLDKARSFITRNPQSPPNHVAPPAGHSVSAGSAFGRTSRNTSFQGCLPPRTDGASRAAPSTRPRLNPVVTAEMMTFMQVGNAVMSTVKELLPLGPGNQIFANADPTHPGRAFMGEQISSRIAVAISPRFGENKENLLSEYAEKHPLVKELSPFVYESTDPNLAKLVVAAGTGGCNTFAGLTAVLMAQALHAKGKSFEVLVVQQHPDDDTAETGLNATHTFALVRPFNDHYNEQAIVLDSWVQNSASRPVAHTVYGGKMNIKWDAPIVKIVSAADGQAPKAQFWEGSSRGRVDVDFSALPQEADYRAVQGLISREAVESFIENHPKRKEFFGQWSSFAAEIANLYANSGATIANNPEKLRRLETYQAEHDAVPQAPTLYRTYSGSQTVDAGTITFPGAAGIPVSRQVQAAADQNALTTASVREGHTHIPPST
jgi:hypothetical protein